MKKVIDTQEFKVVDNKIIIHLSNEVMKELQLNQNDKVTLSANEDNKLVVESIKHDRAEFNRIIEKLADENDEAFKELVNR